MSHALVFHMPKPVGTCGLHTAHNAFKHGEKASDCQLKKLKSSMSKIFHEAPGRRANCRTVTEMD